MDARRHKHPPCEYLPDGMRRLRSRETLWYVAVGARGKGSKDGGRVLGGRDDDMPGGRSCCAKPRDRAVAECIRKIEVNRDDVWSPDCNGGEAFCQRSCLCDFVHRGVRFQEPLQAFPEDFVIIDQQGTQRHLSSPVDTRPGAFTLEP